MVWRLGSVVLSSIWVREYCAGRLPDHTRHQIPWSLVIRPKHVSLWNALIAGRASMSRTRKLGGSTRTHVPSVASFPTSKNPAHIRCISDHMFPFVQDQQIRKCKHRSCHEARPMFVRCVIGFVVLSSVPSLEALRLVVDLLSLLVGGFALVRLQGACETNQFD